MTHSPTSRIPASIATLAGPPPPRSCCGRACAHNRPSSKEEWFAELLDLACEGMRSGHRQRPSPPITKNGSDPALPSDDCDRRQRTSVARNPRPEKSDWVGYTAHTTASDARVESSEAVGLGERNSFRVRVRARSLSRLRGGGRTRTSKGPEPRDRSLGTAAIEFSDTTGIRKRTSRDTSYRATQSRHPLLSRNLEPTW
jgi:hypothetical protein